MPIYNLCDGTGYVYVCSGCLETPSADSDTCRCNARSKPSEVCEFCEDEPAAVDSICRSCFIDGLASLNRADDMSAEVLAQEYAFAESVGWL